MAQQIILSTDNKQAKSRIVRESYLTALYDLGLATWIMNKLDAQGEFGTAKIGAALNLIQQELSGAYADEVAGLDVFSLELFIKDMQANGYDIAFTNTLPIGLRPAKPSLVTPVGAAGTVSVTVGLATAQSITGVWGRVLRTTGQEAQFEVSATDNANDTYTGIFSVPPGSYTGWFALINDEGLRGFRSDESGQFTIT